MSINWSEKNTAELELFFSTDVKRGMSREQYLQAKAQYGENIIDADFLDRQNFYGLKKKKRNIRAIFSGSVGFAGILYFLTVILLKIMGFDINLYIFLPFYIFLAVIAFMLSISSEKKYEYLYRIARPKTFIIRQDKRKKVFIENIVPGDVIFLAAGDIVPADARLVFADRLSCIRIQTDGTVARAGKTADILKSNPADPQEYSDFDNRASLPANMIYAAEIIDRGSGTAVVTATGKNTYISKLSKLSSISKETKETKETKENGGISSFGSAIPEPAQRDEASAMQKYAAKLSKNFFLASVFLSMVMILLGIVQDRDFITVIMTTLAVMAASFSEQIPIIADFAILSGMHGLSKFGILVKKTSIIDEINQIDTVIAKKNESFTQDKMELKKISGPNQSFDVAFENSTEIGYILSCMAMCASATETGTRARNNNNNNNNNNKKKTIYSGSALDVAVFEALEKCGLTYDGVSQAYQKVGKTIYNPKNGIKSAIVSNPANLSKNNRSSLICFGEANVILKRCTRMTDGKRLLELDRRNINFYGRKINDLYKEYDLIMAVAEKEFITPKNQNTGGTEIETDLNFLGFACFSEPKTSSVFESINYLKKSGVNPVMIADADTAHARSAAVKLGLVKNEKAARILDDAKISRMGDSVFYINSDKFNLFAPISIANKIKLLKFLKFKKKFPALTINDMEEISLLNESCLSFTSVNAETGILKNKASVITKNLTISTILKTIKQSVLIYRNIYKIAHFISILFVSQYLLVLFASLTDGAYILNPPQILWAGIGAGFVFAVSICLNEENRQWHIFRKKIKEYKKPGKFNKALFKYGLVYGFMIFVFVLISFFTCLSMKEFDFLLSIRNSFNLIGVIKQYTSSHAVYSENIKSAQTSAFITYIVSCGLTALQSIKGARFFDLKIFKNKIFTTALIFNIAAGLAALFIPPVRNFFNFGETGAMIFILSVMNGMWPLIITSF